MLTPQRLTQLCSNDPSWIADFIVLNNANGVADRIADVVGNRPVGMVGIADSLQYLLDNNRSTDFVYVLSVPLSLNAFTPDQITAIYSAVGVGTDPDSLSRALATNALRGWQNAPTVEDAPAAQEIINPNATPKPATPPQPMDPAKRKRVITAVLIGLGAVLLIVGTAYAIRVIRRS